MISHTQTIFEKIYSKLIKKFGKDTVLNTKDYFINALKNETEKFDNLYNMLSDKKSKKIFDKIIRLRTAIVFYPKAKTSYVSLFFFCLRYSIIPFIPWGIKLVIYNLFIRRFETKTIKSFILFNTLFLKQYEIKNICEAEKGDTVFDIGAFSGDTAIYFERKCKGCSNIYSFEPIKDFYDNINVVAKNVIAVNKALGDKAATARFNIDGSSSGISEKGSVEVSMTTLDLYVKENNIDKVDFIKVDIEGGEKDMLAGAKDTIAKYRPKINIAIYHGGDMFYEDFYNLPEIIKNMTPNYKYYLRHFTPWWIESTLFCVPIEKQ